MIKANRLMTEAYLSPEVPNLNYIELITFIILTSSRFIIEDSAKLKY
jgi:hypothetical protein